MASIKNYFLLNAALLTAFTVNARNFFVQQDTINQIADCFENFFAKAEKIPSPEKTFIITKAGKTVSVTAFLKKEDMSQESQYGLADLDKDGKKELVIYNYSGGAHCCDQFFFFKNIAPQKFQLAATTFAGNVCINGNNEIVFSFYELFGYFFTCYACAYENTSDVAPQPVAEIKLRYNKGKLSVTPGDRELRSKVYDNLGKLGEQPYQKLATEIDQDNGLRKEVAFNLATYYFSFGKNITETRKLFDKYYKFPDAKKVWAEFFRILNFMKKDNSF